MMVIMHCYTHPHSVTNTDHTTHHSIFTSTVILRLRLVYLLHQEYNNVYIECTVAVKLQVHRVTYCACVNWHSCFGLWKFTNLVQKKNSPAPLIRLYNTLREASYYALCVLYVRGHTFAGETYHCHTGYRNETLKSAVNLRSWGSW